MARRAALEIGRRLRLVAPGGETGAEDRLEIAVPRGAFGSGEHETTAACLELLEELPGLEGARVLDLGSGTGVLGIAAVRLGAAEALLVDPDPLAAATAAEAVRLNGLEQRVRCIEGTLASVTEAGFGVVLANVYGDVLVAEARGLVAAAAPGASIVLSGIAWEHAYDVRRVYEDAGCRLLSSRWGDEYVTLRLQTV